MDDMDMYWSFIDLHNQLLTSVNDASCRWDLTALMTAMHNHKIRMLLDACVANINKNYDALVDDNSYLMLAFKDEIDAVVLVSGQTVDTITFMQLRDLGFSIWNTQRVLMNYNFRNLDFRNFK